ncbi:MAG: cytochrome c family protein [Acidobacteria bacterium]|nr:cytochrome c family protein [Acidobacteriota bacterium]
MSLPALAAGLEPASSAEHCGACHRAIEEAWKDSSHARAVESRLFQDALEAAETEYGGAVRKTCLGCHAPVAVDTGDLQLVRKVSWEGVTCDFCHSIRGVSLEGVNPRADVKFTLVKTGPLKEAVSGAHATEYSAVHTTSAVCATCHEYRNAMGFPVLTTYSEWEQSRYAKDGTQCQGCHMFRVAGDVVDPKVQRSSEAKINLHQMPGSHSLAQLTSTVRASLAAVHENGRLKITVDVTNHAAGHFVPTGSPLRQITMEVRADTYGGQHYREERVYARKVADQHGNPIEREPQAFLKAAKTLSDTRLGPGETRSEAFSFPVPEGTQSQVKVTFWYFYSPLARVESQKRITFLTLNRLVK